MDPRPSQQIVSKNGATAGFRRPLTAVAVLIVAVILQPFAASNANGQCAFYFLAGTTFAFGNEPVSVATGDLNGDGIADLAYSSAIDQTIKVFLAYGNGNVSESSYWTGRECFSVAMGHLNADAYLDLAWASPVGLGAILVMLNNGDGTFATPVLYDTGEPSIAVAIGDMNGDGFSDIVETAYLGSTVSVLFGNGNGSFQAPVQTTAFGSSPALSDFNGDTRPDLVVAYGSSVQVSMSNGNGTLAAAVSYGTAGNPIHITIGDLNGDTLPDIATANDNGSVSVLLGNANGTFQAAVTFPGGTPGTRHWVTIGDLNADGKPDLARTLNNGFAMLPGNGDGTFGTAVFMAESSPTTTVAISDLNSDAKPDIVTSLQTSGGALRMRLNACTGFAPPRVTQQPVSQIAQSGYSAAFTAVADGFGATLTYQWRRNGAPLANGGNISGATTTTLVINPTDPADMATYDLLVTSPMACGGGTQTTTSNTAVLGIIGLPVPLMCAQAFAAEVRYDVGECTASLAVGDLNMDGIADLAVANQCSSPQDLSILLGNGDGTYATAVNYAVGSGVRTVSIGDLNGDGVGDVVVVRAGATSVLLGNGDGTVAAPMHYTAGSNASSAAIADLNGDGAADLVVTNEGGNNVSVLLGHGDGTFPGPINYAAGAVPRSVAIGDLNNDGMLDLAVANASSNTVSVLLGNGDGSFAAAINSPAGSGVAQVVIGDLNSDGLLDLAVSNFSTGSVAVLRGNGDGTFQAPTNHGAGPGNVRSVGLADLNGDGRLDLAMTREFGNRVSIYLGIGSGNFGPEVNYNVSGIPTFIAIENLNGDGRPDLAVATYGGGDVSILVNQSQSIQIGSQPVSQTLAAGATATFISTVSGNGTSTLQWRRNGVPLINGDVYSGVTTDTLTITNVTAQNQGAYDLRVIGIGCNSNVILTSRPAALNINSAPVCVGDFNLDEIFDAGDVQGFVDALLAGDTCQ
ncbi:hypothetical protein B7486_08240 [cyanobacterium TDX16]|nr:hypothetical protein B7486_08240 [cyanobacterium TDX16]